ncbi:YwbE family protein [Deinococcus sp. JMULE3]|uniref:YwbE family protein n=1 Tax=Deinococcus sp. JMULE3 TaxID=2518341 RepID=UPI0015757D6D|nr:YwbE family protein [Deinococcus sp. JMULE3]NTY00607.1 YwbE family protein [Deinococcus sp. JMULE3]
MPPIRTQIQPGAVVDIVQKQDQPTGRLTQGVVAALLTRSPSHPHGIKVRLTSGQVGRVQAVITPSE